MSKGCHLKSRQNLRLHFTTLKNGGEWAYTVRCHGIRPNQIGAEVARINPSMSPYFDLEALGHLFAAAPELLEALESMMELADREELDTAWPDECARATAAIAKARGGEA